MICIYKIVSPTNKIYVGQTTNIHSRIRQYKCLSLKPIKTQTKLYNSFKKYGWKNHVFQIIHELPNDIDQNIINRYEVYYWQQYKDCGFTMLNTREPGSRGRHSEKTKKRISISNKGRVFSSDHIKNIKKALNREETRKVRILNKIGKNNPLAKKVSLYNEENQIIKTWDTLTEAAKELNVSVSSISSNCSGKINIVNKKYIFKYTKQL